MSSAERAPAKRQVITVLGMQRSGTSALTGVLAHLGAAAPATPIPGGAENPKGFFESLPMARLNDRLLEEAGRRWDDWVPMPADWTDHPDVAQLHSRAVALLDMEFGAAPLMAFKDPRLCRLFPFWADVFEGLGIAISVVLPLRHPREVAESLLKRNGFPLAKGFLLWLSYVLEAESVSRGSTRAITSFDRLMADPAGEIERVEKALGQDFPVVPGDRDSALAGFLEGDLRHHHTAGLEDLPEMVAVVYEVMSRWAETGEDPSDYPALDEMSRRFRIVAQAADECGFEFSFQRSTESNLQQAAQVTVLRSETDELRRMLDIERERVHTLLDRIEFAAGLVRTPITTSLKRNLAKLVLKNFPWLSESQRAKLQRSVAKREYRQLFGVRASIENNVALAPLPVPVSKIYPGHSRDFGKIPPPVAPSELDWDTLVPSGGIVASDPVIDIIVPVYRGFDETMRCLFSVISQVQQTPFRIIVINDCSPDTSLTHALRELANREWIVLVENTENLGFVLTCNRGMRINVQRDVLLLNSDTEVYSNWLDRMVSRSKEDETAGTLTPFSNNATICSYPYFAEDNHQSLEIDSDKIDAIASQVCLSEKMIELPTAIGFCMYIRRSALNEVGLFDEHKFGKGYGEENDLSRRLIAAGWKNMFVPNVYVRHWGAVSFGVGADHRKNTAKKKLKICIRPITLKFRNLYRMTH